MTDKGHRPRIMVARDGKVLGTFEYYDVFQSLLDNDGRFKDSDFYWYGAMPGWLTLGWLFYESPRRRLDSPPPPFVGSPPPFIP